MLAISEAQYCKPQKTASRERFTLRTSTYNDTDDNDDEDSDGSDIGIESEIVDDQFTIENIGEVAAQVRSDVSALQFLMWPCPWRRFLNETAGSAASLIEYAISKDDVDLLVWLLRVGQEIKAKNKPADDSNDNSQSPLTFTVSACEFELAIQLGRLRCLAELIRHSGAGLALDALVSKSGVDPVERPRYYQGLSVYGRKRADWAAAGRGSRVLDQSQVGCPPLLVAARIGNLESVEWFLSTAPLRCYMEFASSFKNDERFKRMAGTKTGIEGLIRSWLGVRSEFFRLRLVSLRCTQHLSCIYIYIYVCTVLTFLGHLVLHCAVLSEAGNEAERLIKYLLQNVPECIESRSAEGYTPLALAFALGRESAARLLIDAGANQKFRDCGGNNLVHLLLSGIENQPRKDAGRIEQMVKLLDPALVPTLLVQRSSDGNNNGAAVSTTPLAKWLYGFVSRLGGRQNIDERSPRAELMADMAAVLGVILDAGQATGQKQLELLDGAGNTPLHVVVWNGLVQALEMMLERRADLLHRENSTGNTPAELAETSWVAGIVETAVSCSSWSWMWSSFESRSELSYQIPIPPGANFDVQHALSAMPDLALAGVVTEETRRSRSRALVRQICAQQVSADAHASKRPLRRLVSLGEANEVAARLAVVARPRLARYGSIKATGESYEIRDEVMGWYAPTGWM